MRLAELQAAFQSAVLTGAGKDATVLASLAKPPTRERSAGFGVYVKGYRLRLAEYLEEDFPTLKRLLGAKRFDALVSDYVSACPSRTRNARYYSARLPEFMQDSGKWREAQALGVARLERALTDAFDAPDGDSCALEALAEYAPQDWPRLVFAFHPSLSLVSVAAGAVELYEALSSEDAATPRVEPRDGEEAAAVWRSGFDPVYRALEADEFLALNEALAGKSFGAICQLVAFQQDEAAAPERLAQFLVNWFSDGLVVAIEESDDAESAAAP